MIIVSKLIENLLINKNLIDRRILESAFDLKKFAVRVWLFDFKILNKFKLSKNKQLEAIKTSDLALN